MEKIKKICGDCKHIEITDINSDWICRNCESDDITKRKIQYSRGA